MNQLSLNLKKTKAMTVVSYAAKKTIVQTITINGTIIEFVDNFNV